MRNHHTKKFVGSSIYGASHQIAGGSPQGTLLGVHGVSGTVQQQRLLCGQQPQIQV